MFCLITHNTQA